MKKTLLFAGMLLAVSAAVASASGLNLGWGLFCPTNISSQSNQTDPCDGSSQANGLTYNLIGSWKTPDGLLGVEAEDFFVDLQEGAAQISDYWKLEAMNQPGQTNPPGCRGDDPLGTGNIGSMVVAIAQGSFV